MIASPLCWMCTFTYLIIATQSAKILGISCFPAHSHQATFLPIWKELSLRGHQVTALVMNPLRDERLKNLTEIDVSSAYEILEKSNYASNAGYDTSLFQRVLFMRNLMENIVVDILENEKVKKLIEDKKQEFDLLLVEPHQPLVFGFAARFTAPIIAVSSFGVCLDIHDVLGNPTHPVITPDILVNMEQGTAGPVFMSRFNSFFYNIWYRALYYWYTLPRADKIARKYFGNDMPYLGNFVQNVSLLLSNVNPVMHTIRPTVPKVIEIGQLHIKREKTPLPKDLQEYLDQSKNGVIYFSLGSMMSTSNLEQNMLQIIMDALSELPYDVIIKWEKDEFALKKPENILLKKWLPQQDLLSHPNLKAFVTQGGIQSIEEAIFNGVPMICLPLAADQTKNVKRIEEMGIAKGLNTNGLTKGPLKDAILQVATDESYKRNILNVKRLLQDQPMKGVDKAIWWIEYIIRNEGAPHLQAPAATMSFFQYFMVDILLFIVVIVILVCTVFGILISLICTGKNKKIKTE